MPPVGNDIVDLAAPGNPGKSGDKRFCGRVFTAEERVLIDGAANPDAFLWALWAAKEAAYKAVSRANPAVCSIPTQYCVEIHGESVPTIDPVSSSVRDFRIQGNGGRNNVFSGEVITPRGRLALRIERTTDWVHALVAESGEAIERLYRRVETPCNYDDPSAFVRAGLLGEIARLLGCNLDDLSVIEDPDCPAAPIVHFRRFPLTKEVSLSHDGRFAAFAFDPLVLIFPGALC